MNCFPDVTDIICKGFSPDKEVDRLIWCISNSVFNIPTNNGGVIPLEVGDVIGFCSTKYRDTNGQMKIMNFAFYKNELIGVKLLNDTLSFNIGDGKVLSSITTQIIREYRLEKLLD